MIGQQGPGGGWICAPCGGSGRRTNHFFTVPIATTSVNLLGGGDNPKGSGGLKEVD